MNDMSVDSSVILEYRTKLKVNSPETKLHCCFRRSIIMHRMMLDIANVLISQFYTTAVNAVLTVKSDQKNNPEKTIFWPYHRIREHLFLQAFEHPQGTTT